MESSDRIYGLRHHFLPVGAVRAELLRIDEAPLFRYPIPVLSKEGILQDVENRNDLGAVGFGCYAFCTMTFVVLALLSAPFALLRWSEQVRGAYWSTGSDSLSWVSSNFVYIGAPLYLVWVSWQLYSGYAYINERVMQTHQRKRCRVALYASMLAGISAGISLFQVAVQRDFEDSLPIGILSIMSLSVSWALFSQVQQELTK